MSVRKTILALLLALPLAAASFFDAPEARGDATAVEAACHASAASTRAAWVWAVLLSSKAAQATARAAAARLTLAFVGSAA